MKHGIVIFALVTAFLILCGCNKTTVTAPDNEVPRQSAGNGKLQKFDTEDMVTIGGETVSLEPGQYFVLEHLGVGMVLSETLYGDAADNIGIYDLDGCVLLSYYPDSTISVFSDKSSDEAAVEDAYARSHVCFALIRTSDELNDNGTKMLELLGDSFTEEIMVAETDEAKYYYLYNDNYDFSLVEEEEHELIKKVLAELPAMKDGIIIFEPEKRPEASFRTISASTLTGETFTAEDFAEYKVTMVNVWATWCDPCLSELPDIQDMMDELPEGANVISICDDAYVDTELAIEVADVYGLTFPVLMPNEDVNNDILDYVQSFPTTYFIDSEGEIIGKPIVGVPASPKETYLNVINKALGAAED